MVFYWESGHFHFALKAWSSKDARRVSGVRSACLHGHLLGIAVAFMTYLGIERGWQRLALHCLSDATRLSFAHWRLCIMLSIMELRFIVCHIYCCCTWSSQMTCVHAATFAVWFKAHLQYATLSEYNDYCASLVNFGRCLSEEPVLLCVSMTQQCKLLWLHIGHPGFCSWSHVLCYWL